MQKNAQTVIASLQAAVEAYPEQRVGQIIVNALGSDPFFVENAQAAHRLAEYAMEGRKSLVVQPTSEEAVCGGHEDYGFVARDDD